MSDKKYPLKDILRVRKIKQDAALEELNKQKRLLKEAEKKIEKQEIRIQRFEAWLPTEEKKLFDKIIGKVVPKERISEIKTRLESHQDRLTQHYDRLKKFKEQKKEVEAALEAARAAYQEFTYNIEKLLEHKKEWQKEFNKEQEAFQEREMEDVPYKRKDL